MEFFEVSVVVVNLCLGILAVVQARYIRYLEKSRNQWVQFTEDWKKFSLDTLKMWGAQADELKASFGGKPPSKKKHDQPAH